MKGVIAGIFDCIRATVYPAHFIQDCLPKRRFGFPNLARLPRCSLEDVALHAVAFDRMPDRQELVGIAAPITVQNKSASWLWRPFQANAICPKAAT